MPTPIPVNPDLLLALAEAAYAGLTDANAAVAISARPPVARPGPVLVTYASLGTARDLLGPNALNVAGGISTGLKAWIASGVDLSTVNPALPNPGVLEIIQTRLSGAKGLDLTDPSTPGLLALFAAGVAPAGLAPILTAAQAAAILSLGYVVQGPVTTGDVAAARAVLARRDPAAAAVKAIMDWSAYAYAAVNAYAAGTAEALPVVPAVPAGGTVQA